MTDLEKAIILLTVEIRGLRADLGFSTTKKVLLQEKKDRLSKSSALIAKLNKRRNLCEKQVDTIGRLLNEKEVQCL